MLWIYLVKSKSKWFSTLKKLIREYHKCEISQAEIFEVRLLLRAPKFRLNRILQRFRLLLQNSAP